VSRILKNERYLGRQIWGQQAVEREPATGRKIMRDRPRSEWKVVERPNLRIVSDELWERTQATRREIREAVAPKNLARGKSGKHHSHHLFTGFTKCAVCGGAISSVSGGKGSPRFGCRRSWQEGLSACPNRLTIRIKVVEPQILAKLHAELQSPAALAYATKALERELKKASSAGTTRPEDLKKRLDQEQRKLRNLLSALEGGASAPATILKAMAEREASIAQLERELRAPPAERPPGPLQDVHRWVERQLADLTVLLKSDPTRVKAEFRRLNLQLTFTPVEAEPRAHYVVKGQCDLSALVFSVVQPAGRRAAG
jgi:site-specific DNA recombinase